MSEKRSRRPQKIDFTDREMLVGDFRQVSVEPSGAWDAAVQARTNALTGFRLLRAVRPDLDPYPVEVASTREDVVELAGRLVEAAVDYEMPELMAETTAALRADTLDS